MAGSSSEDSGVGRSLEGMSNGQQRSGEALAEWRSSEQVENGIASTSPPFWDTDDDDECGGLKPSELYGKYTWKIDKFSQINKRELRSNAFEVGGYKWYILIYPQGCDVCNHLSLFLCVANHDKLLPGWSHFAQFTIAVVNKDPKKSKYSDTLHRFWKKEHDWGWKKFMELSKVLDGFVDADTLIIKAQVQVIRERADRPFRCLDCQYRRELVRVYLSNVEQICRRFVEERRGRLGKLIEDKARWSSFCSFWLGIDQNTKRRMSREKLDLILKVVVKHFFIEKEVTSTLVMDSLYSGLKALEGPTKSKKSKEKCLDAEEPPMPVVQVEKDTFILVDDVLLLLERAAMEPLPPKEEKGPQNRTKDGGTGEDFSKDSIERDERRLTELGRRTIEIFVLAHIFSKIEVAYQEAVALKRQEELIREEEAAWMAGNEQKSKRSEKEKKSKKKQGKQKRNNRKQKDKTREEKPDPALEDKPPSQTSTEGRKGFPMEDISDVSDSVDRVPEAILQPDSYFRESSPVNWDTDTFEPHPPIEASSSCVNGLSAANNGEIKSLSMVDDSSSTCSTDSLASVAMNGPNRGNSVQNQKIQKLPSRAKVKRGKGTDGVTGWAHNVHRETSDITSEAIHTNDVPISSKVDEPEPDVVVLSLHDRIKWLEHHVVKKEDEVVSLQKKLNAKDEVVPPRRLKEKSAAIPSSPKSPPNKSDPKKTAASAPSIAGKPSLGKTQHTVSSSSSSSNSSETLVSSKPPHVLRSGTQKPTEKSMNGHGALTTEKPIAHQVLKTVEKPPAQQVHVSTSEKPLTRAAPAVSRPLSAPLVPGPRPSAATPVVSMVQTSPLLSRSVSAAGRLGPDPSPATQSFVPQSYRNAMMGNHNPNPNPNPVTVAATSTAFIKSLSSNLTVNSSPSYSQPPQSLTASAPIFLPQSSERAVSNNIIGPRYSFQVANNDILQTGSQWMDPCGPLLNDIQNFNLFKPANTRSQGHPSGMLADEFPHLDIINDLLDDECGISNSSSMFQSFGNGPHRLNRQFTFPGDISGSLDQGPSTSSCEFEHGYGGGQFDFSRELTPQQPYTNIHNDGLMQSQSQMGGSDVGYFGSRNMDSDEYQYHMQEYSNLTMGVNGYTVYRPSNAQ